MAFRCPIDLRLEECLFADLRNLRRAGPMRWLLLNRADARKSRDLAAARERSCSASSYGAMKNSKPISRPTPWTFLSPSSTLLKFVGEIAYPGGITLDLPCGFGRHAILMAAYGCDVICADKDLTRLRHLDTMKVTLLEQAPNDVASGHITTVCAELTADQWPFEKLSFDAIVIVHFVRLELFPFLIPTLRVGGHLYFETFGGHGQNHLDLPRPGEVKMALGVNFDLRYYEDGGKRPALDV
jgi:SAM-dependent methyltransferase